ncbi:MAG: class I SAM-dependent methyltransferase [Thermomicrobiales bacterium]
MEDDTDTLVLYYDDVHQDVVSDLEFYLSETAAYQPRILEVGCGTGRLLLRFAEQGRAVFGIDISSPALDMLRGKLELADIEVSSRVGYEIGDIRNYSPDLGFDVVIFANQGFLSLLTIDDQILALSQMRRILNPGGVVMIDFFEPNSRAIGDGLKPEAAAPRIVRLGENATERVPLLRGDGYLVHWIKSDWDTMSQIVSHTMVIDEVGTDGRVRSRRYADLPQRWVYRFEFEHLAARCGFRVKHLYGGPERGPHRTTGQQLFWVLQPLSDDGEAVPV